MLICTCDKDSCQFANIICQQNNELACKLVARTSKYLLSNQQGKEVENMPLYNRLKEYRAKISVNQQEMGALVGASRQTISLIERGDYSPSITLALKIAKVFDVPVEDIFDYVEDDEDMGGNEE